MENKYGFQILSNSYKPIEKIVEGNGMWGQYTTCEYKGFDVLIYDYTTQFILEVGFKGDRGGRIIHRLRVQTPDFGKLRKPEIWLRYATEIMDTFVENFDEFLKTVR